jgi:hypothetical protein
VGTGFLQVVLAASILVAPAAQAFAAEEKQVTVDCPGYVAHLVNAQTNFERGNRPAAIAELRQAKAALGDCLREQASSETALATWEPARDPVCDERFGA